MRQRQDKPHRGPDLYFDHGQRRPDPDGYDVHPVRAGRTGMALPARYTPRGRNDDLGYTPAEVAHMWRNL